MGVVYVASNSSVCICFWISEHMHLGCVKVLRGGIPRRGSGDREMDGPRCSWKPRETPRVFFLLERSPVTNGFMLGRWGC